ncbi:MAG: aminopeptidase P family protein [Actinobacteria bacterium]|nr:aminopeptidase P family protein [Actinomycetota bacterium]
MPDVLVYADSIRSPELRHEVPVAVPDPFLYGEHAGTSHVLVHVMEAARMGGLGLELHPNEEYGYDELVARGLHRYELLRELCLRACRAWGIESAAVPATFPLELADFLRGGGVELTADRELFAHRRRRKNEAELAGIRRAQRAAEAGMTAARELLRSARPNGSGLVAGGEPLTSERLKLVLEQAFSQHECSADEMVASHGAQTAIAHHMGEGAILPNEPIVIDVWPRDRQTGCYADMTRTFVVGEPADDIRAWHALCVQALEDAVAGTRAGVRDADLNRATCELFAGHGHPTTLTKEPGTPLEDGFFHGLGHGVGLEVHEAPILGVVGKDDLVAGDVITVEPGLYRKSYGGVRVEDLLLVTEDGAENLTRFPYDLEP